MMPLKLGIIGLSEGNGHPYSWSAIFNGYDPVLMEDCGFPVIPRYLEQQQFPQDGLASVANVTHIWAQDKTLAQHIASATHITHVVDHYEDMIGQVDAVLLARDDAENHRNFALPFLRGGLPIYIDKPLALSVADAEYLFAQQQYAGQIFTCSALRYAEELQLSAAAKQQLGYIQHLYATTPKSWDKYAIHIIEPALKMLGADVPITATQVWQQGDATSLQVGFANDAQLHLHTLGQVVAPLGFRLVGDAGWQDFMFKDTFAAFKAALNDFLDGVIHQQVRCDQKNVLKIIGLIEAGRKP